MPTSESELALELVDVTAGYGRLRVVHGVDLQIRRGECVALLGANGVGKTTLLRAVVGMATLSSGTVRLHGRDVSRWPTHEIARAGVAVVPEGRALIPELSVRDNLLLGTTVWNRRFRSQAVDDALEQIYREFPILKERRLQTAGRMSGGQQQMLAIGRALIARPDVLILDEPSLGLAPRVVSEVFDRLHAVSATGVTVLVAEQNARAAMRVAGRSFVLTGGRIAPGPEPGTDLSDDLSAVYLGYDRDRPPG
ncbi:ABC transporter ATP-binding protein [Streptomyces marispadix]|uniref:ABC transporter ATP-binding protein n=1 Tax=Streptomyces marispadix TaxID=2922868 RepID=A0ABS9T5P2_9ACTN|nr:ABC transporter ATP-binding protein [Streptomyces marispadix]MCH6163842.1 ABC transporter ATP-binding protein [Streptomyces marispadix]